MGSIKKPKKDLYHCAKPECGEKHETYMIGYSYDTEITVQAKLQKDKAFKKCYHESTQVRKGTLERNWQLI